MKKIFKIFGILFLTSSFALFANEGVVNLGSGTVDYTKGLVTSSGTGDTTEAALIVARAKLVETINGVEINSEKTVGVKDGVNFITNQNIIQNAIGHVVNDALVSTERLSNGLYKMTLTAKISNVTKVRARLQETLLGEFSEEEPSVVTVPFGAEYSSVDESNKGVELVVQEPQGELQEEILPVVDLVRTPVVEKEVYTGLIVNIQGFKNDFLPQPTLSIVDEAGKELYGTAFVSPKWVDSNAMAGYAITIDEARGRTDRVGDNPLEIEGISAKGSTIVVSKETAAKLEELSEDLTFFRDAKVVVLFGSVL